jgi:hypothetical protein
VSWDGRRADLLVKEGDGTVKEALGLGLARVGAHGHRAEEPIGIGVEEVEQVSGPLHACGEVLLGGAADGAGDDDHVLELQRAPKAQLTQDWQKLRRRVVL